MQGIGNHWLLQNDPLSQGFLWKSFRAKCPKIPPFHKSEKKKRLTPCYAVQCLAVYQNLIIRASYIVIRPCHIASVIVMNVEIKSL